MIEVVGHPGSSEYEAAIALKEAIQGMWPSIAKSPKNKDHVIISANVKISGYQVSDIDIVLAGRLSGDYQLSPAKVLKDRSGKAHLNQPITVKNFVVAIEVKDHSERYVQRVGDAIEVYYSKGASPGWKSATEQNVKQLHSLRHYFSDFGVEDVFIHRCLLMRGLSRLDAPGAIHSGFSGEDFFTSLAALSRVDSTLSGLEFKSGNDAALSSILTTPIFKTIIPSALDRKRMDLLVSDTPEIAMLIPVLGKKMVTLRGHGGTGKTVMLLQAAWKVYQEQGARTIVLTYNHALAADVRRLLALLGVPSDPNEGGIAIRTVMSFMYTWFSRLDLIDEGKKQSFDDYDDLCKNALELLKEGAVNRADIKSVIDDDPDKFDFNYIMVDEAQDWPSEEAGLLKELYGYKNICLADGIDQLIRGDRTDWSKDIAPADCETVPLTHCLRMKRNLAVFVNSVAKDAGVNWPVIPNDKAGGGSVILLSSSYTNSIDLHHDLIGNAKDKGNAEIDFLYCVPPSSVNHEANPKTSQLGDFLLEQGCECWDGIDSSIRKDFPRSKKQFRVVQYDSCRGLEGWTVILESLDEFWERRYQKRKAAGLSKEEEMAFEDIEEVAEGFAWKQVIMALCRPIDTLVITLSNTESEFSKKLKSICMEQDEIVDVFPG